MSDEKAAMNGASVNVSEEKAFDARAVIDERPSVKKAKKIVFTRTSIPFTEDPNTGNGIDVSLASKENARETDEDVKVR